MGQYREELRKMKIVILLSVTAFMATGAVGLKCYDCGNAPIKGTCTTEKDCPTWANACVTTYLGNDGTMRTCGSKVQESNCDQDQEKGVCACTSDLCNGNPVTRTTAPTPIATVNATVEAIRSTPGNTRTGNTRTGNTGTGNTGTGKAGNSGKKEMAPLMIIMGATILSILY